MFTRKIKHVNELKGRIEEKDSFLATVNNELIQSDKSPALLTFRNNNATIYYKGRRLCNMPAKAKILDKLLPSYSPTIFNNFLPILRSATLKGAPKEVYYESEYIKVTNNTCTFKSVLPEILDNLDKDKDPESLSVSAFYRFSPMVKSNTSNVILLDIEAAFAENGEKTKRIDMVLYNTDTKELIFVEVKRLSDSRLYPDPTTKAEAEIMTQMRNYRIILKDQTIHIKKQYNNVIRYYNAIAGKHIEVMDETSEGAPLLGLLIVECTDAESKHRENASLEFQGLCSNLNKEGFKLHMHGDTSNITPGTMEKIYKSFK